MSRVVVKIDYGKRQTTNDELVSTKVEIAIRQVLGQLFSDGAIDMPTIQIKNES